MPSDSSIKPVNLRLHSRIAVGYFLVAALLGLVLRLLPIIDLPVNYRFIVHTHSHIALLGWLYLAITTLIYHIYLRHKNLDKKYRRLYGFTQIMLLGMLFTFPFMGYAVFSIVFSTLFLIASYWFTGFFIRHVDESSKNTTAYHCFKWSLIYLVLSSLGPWALGGIMNTLGSQSDWYRFSIYFYLHFLYNGFAVMALFGLAFYLLEQQRIALPTERTGLFLLWMNGSIFLTFFISIIWMEPSFTFYCLAVAGIIAQWAAFSIFLRMVKGGISVLKDQLPSVTKTMLLITLLLYTGKLILQTLVAIPELTDLAFKLNDLVIGFLHWVFLGFLTIGLFTFLHYLKLIRISRVALVLYLIGFALTEFLLFYRAAAIWQHLPLFKGHLQLLPVASAFIPAALLLILVNSYNIRKT